MEISIGFSDYLLMYTFFNKRQLCIFLRAVIAIDHTVTHLE